LLGQIDATVARLNTSRSALFRQAIEFLFAEQQRQELRDLLKEGYLYRAEESRQMAQEFFIAEKEAWDRYAPWEE
jgi:metal-responsive CopG/Arc/MetJ family transcriptional regulator